MNTGAADKRVHHQLHRAILFAGGTPDRDDEVLGNGASSVKHEQQEQIHRQKHAVHARDHVKEEREEFLDAILMFQLKRSP